MTSPRRSFLTAVFSVSLFAAIPLWPAATASAERSADAPDRPEPLLVKVGWDGGGPQKLLDNLDRVRDLPFDGHTFKLGFRLQNAFWKEAIPAEEFEPHRAAMRELMERDLGNARHNLVMIWCTAEAGWDWFDDDHWEAALANMRQLAELAAIGGCDLFWDPESYPALEAHFGQDAFWPFIYQDNPGHEEHSYEAYKERIFACGAGFARMLQEVDPEIDVLSMYGFGVFMDLLDEPDLSRMNQKIKERNYYNLLPAFLAGMLSEAHEGLEVFDGNEPAYYYRKAGDFYEDRHQLLTRGRRLLPETLRGEFPEHYRFSNAIYASDLYAADPEATDQYRAFFVQEMTREQQAEFLAHNVFYALHSSDRYAWFYTENDIDVYTGEVPDGMIEAIEDAKQHLREGRKYPKRISEVVAAASDAYEERARGLIARGEAVSVLAGDDLKVDGVADEEHWARAEAHAFRLPLPKEQGGYEVPMGTTLKVAHDGEHLHLLVRTEVGERSELKAPAGARDGDVWSGDDVEFAIQDPTDPDRFVLLMVDPEGVRYDAAVRPAQGEEDPEISNGYDPQWSFAMSFPDGAWQVEAAIPWEAIGGRPRNDQDLRLNACRSFTMQPGLNFASFSQVTTGFLDPEEFGTVKLGR
ncbi:DOMON domain-containing protein [Phycisphaera mikurensis]|uniref:Carbohydrate-binding domain-containing protein n=1 Tax=Phycisphaera mikurensis (strain NBRC 102666 / KCTC 22515 / FYK2301M01) TaxID=1142394 RepID=I0ICT5_PHYMF|nr:hypothetical protein [Phycisphaera mikurensis]MBB6443307.1 hypothetical protein [Phycisphaera mikurensis]BAM03073.1 hypothetical protein PSMK_09140 [Phycisphaera mikurensis NBRC 102666]